MIEEVESAGESLVPLHLDGHVIYLASSISSGTSSDEMEVASRPASLDDALAGLSAFAARVGEGLRDAGVTRLTVEVSCEFAIDSGKFIAIVGKASAKSGVKVGLEWDRSNP
ncbi:CU044_2847 family protein [Micromonospora sp. NPDC005087]|uniref:CU044_2847 family protein n=1 Tax=Micromonospora sp. NPDC005087 TaxID=3364225 RepID=UPI0036C53F50